MSTALIGHPVTTVHRNPKQFQFWEEATYGTSGTNPTPIDASVIHTTRTTYNSAHEMYRKMGNRDIYKYLLLHKELTWSCTFSPVDTALIRRVTELGNSTGTATGTVDKGVTFFNSRMQNSGGTLTEFYIVRSGTKGDSITVTTSSGGMVEVSIDWISRLIPKPTTVSPLGTSQPATPTTASPWTHATGATGSPASKLLIDSVPYAFKTFSFTVNNNLDAVDIDSSLFIEALEPTTREITGSVELLTGKDTLLDDDVETLAADDIVLTLNATGPKTATLTGCILHQRTEDESSKSTSVSTSTYAIRAQSITVSA